MSPIAKMVEKGHGICRNLVALCLRCADIERRLIAECRGLVLDEDNDLAVVAYPYERFFNYGESLAGE